MAQQSEVRCQAGRQRDREHMDALRALAFNLFQFADIQTLMEGRRALCREANNWLFIAVFVT